MYFESEIVVCHIGHLLVRFSLVPLGVGCDFHLFCGIGVSVCFGVS